MKFINIYENRSGKWISLRELHEFLEIKKSYESWEENIKARSLFGLFEDDQVENYRAEYETVKCEKNNVITDETMITITCAKHICFEQEQSPKVTRVLEQLGVLAEQLKPRTAFNFGFISKLKEAVFELDIKGFENYCVGKFIIDFYIPEYKLAIEYDECVHFNETNKLEDQRKEKFITDTMHLNLIRCNYYDSNIKNIMKVLKNILWNDKE